MSKSGEQIRFRNEDGQLLLFDATKLIKGQKLRSHSYIREALGLPPDTVIYESQGRHFYYVDEEAVEQVNLNIVRHYHGQRGRHKNQLVLPSFDDTQSNGVITVSTIHSEKLIPPNRAEQLLLLILSKPEREYLVGDLAEEFAEIGAKHGARYAKLWYYKQVAASAWPMVRKAVKWGVWAWVGEWIRRRV